MQTKTITYKNHSVSYHIGGTGKTVLLIHGFGETADVWQNQISFLEQSFQIIVPGIPGGGLSEYNPELSSLEDYADVIKSILDAESIQDCTMFGHSMGGYIVLVFAALFPERLNRFGLIHSSAFADNEEKIATRKKSIDFILNNGSEAYFKASVPGLFSETTAQEQPQLIQELISSIRILLPEALAQHQNAMISRPDRTETLKKSSGPVLFVIGQNDKAIPFDAAMKQCYLPEISHIHILRRSGHMGMWEEPEKVNAAMAGFLAAIDG